MPTLRFTASIATNNNLHIRSIEQALRHLGEVTITYETRIETADSSHCENFVWLFCDGPDDPYIKVAEAGEFDGEEVVDDEFEYFQREGVVVEVRAVYPRADRYGAPSYASLDDDCQMAFVCDKGFSVDPNALKFTARDSHDDSGETCWIKLALP